MFGTKNVELEEPSSGISKYLSYGIKTVRINYFEVKIAATGSKQVIMNVESSTNDDPDFEPDENAMIGGQIGRVEFTIYMDPDKPSFESIEKAFNEDINIIADKLGLTTEVDDISDTADLESYLDQLNNVLGESDFFHLAITAKEYINKDGDTRFTLGKRRWGFIASMKEGEGKLKEFNKDNQYDYKKAPVPSEPEIITAEEDDLPF